MINNQEYEKGLQQIIGNQQQRIDDAIKILRENIHFDTHGDCFTCRLLQSAVDILEGRGSTRVFIDGKGKFQFEPNLPPMTLREYTNWCNQELEKTEGTPDETR